VLWVVDLGSVVFCVFDESDRVFKMGFAEQVGMIDHGLPCS
jgi:superfamily II DNA/RNA helicase